MERCRIYHCCVLIPMCIHINIWRSNIYSECDLIWIWSRIVGQTCLEYILECCAEDFTITHNHRFILRRDFKLKAAQYFHLGFTEEWQCQNYSIWRTHIYRHYLINILSIWICWELLLHFIFFLILLLNWKVLWHSLLRKE